jgi:hypothetical protein
MTSATLHDLIPTLWLLQELQHMLCHITLYLASRARVHHVFHQVTNYWPDNFRSVSRQHITIYGIRGLTSGWHNPCVPSFVKFYLFYGLFLCLNQCFTILFSLFCLSLCFLLATDRLHFHFILHFFTIKSPVHRGENQNITTPQNHPDFVSENLFTRLCMLLHFTAFCLFVAYFVVLSLITFRHHFLLCEVRFFQESSFYTVAQKTVHMF